LEEIQEIYRFRRCIEYFCSDGFGLKVSCHGVGRGFFQITEADGKRLFHRPGYWDYSDDEIFHVINVPGPIGPQRYDSMYGTVTSSNGKSDGAGEGDYCFGGAVSGE
jgi:hypothetical protein